MKVFRLLLIALSMAVSSNAVAGTIHIELTSLIQSPTGDFEASAFFDLDADQFLGSTSFNSDIVLDAGFESPVLSGSIMDSGFNLGLARNLSGGVVGFSFAADYGPQVFSAELFFDGFVSDNALDFLTSGIGFDDLLPFNPSQLVSSNFNFFGADPFVIYTGGLTSLSIELVHSIPEPTMSVLLGLGMMTMFATRQLNRRR